MLFTRWQLCKTGVANIGSYWYLMGKIWSEKILVWTICTQCDPLWNQSDIPGCKTVDEKRKHIHHRKQFTVLLYNLTTEYVRVLALSRQVLVLCYVTGDLILVKLVHHSTPGRGWPVRDTIKFRDVRIGQSTIRWDPNKTILGILKICWSNDL